VVDPAVLVVLKLATTELVPAGIVRVVFNNEPMFGEDELRSTVVGVSAIVGTPWASTNEMKIAG
jgi:hypothetical protein